MFISTFISAYSWFCTSSFAYQQIYGASNTVRIGGLHQRSVSYSDVTFEDAITAVAESNLLITWRVQRWAVCEINLMLSVTRQDKIPVFLEHSRIGCSYKVKHKTQNKWFKWNFQMPKQADGICYTLLQLETHSLLCVNFRKKLVGSWTDIKRVNMLCFCLPIVNLLSQTNI